MIRVDVDTNVFILALFHQDRDSLAVLQMVRDRRICGVCSPDMVIEVMMTVMCHCQEAGLTLELPLVEI